jgi:hypothetical protein
MRENANMGKLLIDVLSQINGSIVFDEEERLKMNSLNRILSEELMILCLLRNSLPFTSLTVHCYTHKILVYLFLDYSMTRSVIHII